MSDERPRGILSPADRRYLRGETNYEDASSERKARMRIRERVRHALMDLPLLLEHLDERDRKQLLDEHLFRPDHQYVLRDEERTEGPPEVKWEAIDPAETERPINTGGLKVLHVFCYLMLLDGIEEEAAIMPAELEAVVEELVSEALCDAFGKHGRVVEPEVEVDIEEIDVDVGELHERFEAGFDVLTDREVDWLTALREIEFEEMANYIWETRHAGGNEREQSGNRA